jgi:hypothetical protein
LKENELTQRRSPAGTRKAIGFENPEENNKWQMPVGLGRQNNSRADGKAEYRQLSCMTQIASTARDAIVRVGRTYIGDKE